MNPKDDPQGYAIIYRDRKKDPWQLQCFTVKLDHAHRSAASTIEQEYLDKHSTFEAHVILRSDYDKECFNKIIKPPHEIVRKIKSTDLIICDKMSEPEPEDLSFLDHKGFNDLDV